MTSLEVRNNGLERLNAIRESLSKIETLDAAHEATDQAKAIETYAKAKQSVELVNQAVELRMWAERRAGEIVLETHVDYRAMQYEHRVRPATVNRWITWALAKEPDLANYIREEAEAGRELSLHRMRADILSGSEKRVAPNIYRRLDGSYESRVKANGRVHKRTYSKNTRLETIQAHIEGVRRNYKPVTSVDRAYASVRSLLSALDKEATKAQPAVRHHISEAMNGLHKAEDALGLARRADV